MISISIDLDGVCAEFLPKFWHEGLLPLYWEQLEGYDWEEVSDYYLADVGLTYTQVRTALVTAASKGIYEQLDVVDGSLEGIIALKERGCVLYPVTSRAETGGQQSKIHTYEWLSANGFMEYMEDPVFESDKANLDFIDLLLDDSPDICQGAIDAGKPAIMFRHSYNEDYDGEVIKVHNWPEVVRAVDLLTEFGNKPVSELVS